MENLAEKQAPEVLSSGWKSLVWTRSTNLRGNVESWKAEPVVEQVLFQVSKVEDGKLAQILEYMQIYD